MAKEGTFTLDGGKVYITENSQDAFRVVSGTVLVYVVPYTKQKAGRRSLVFEANEGETLPSFAWMDADYKNWRFCFSAMGKAELMVIPGASTKVLRKKFAVKAGLEHFEIEGFENSLINRYRTNLTAEDAFIYRTHRQQTETKKNIFKLIYNVFHKDAFAFAEEGSENLLYKAASELCADNRIEIAPLEKIEEACGKNEVKISDIARVSSFAYREIMLENQWYKTDIGGIIAFDNNKVPYVCLRKGQNTYVAKNMSTSEKTKVNHSVASGFQPQGIMFYKPFPNQSMGLMDLIRYCVGSMKFSDMVMYVVLTILCTLVSSLVPTLTQKIYNDYIPMGNYILLYQICALVGTFLVANIMFSIVNGIMNYRISSRISYAAQNAAYARIFNLPENFFRTCESGDLAQRLMGMQQIVRSGLSILTSSFTIVITFVVYFVRMLSYSSSLAGVGFAMIFCYGVISWILSQSREKSMEECAELEGESNSKLLQLIGGISKIRIAGVEERAIFEYLKPMTKSRAVEMKAGKLILADETLDAVVDTIFAMVFYVMIMQMNQSDTMNIGTFIAFNSAFGAFSSVFLQAFDNLTQLNELRPQYKRIKPILEAVPEFDLSKEMPGDIDGKIDIDNLTFRYDPEAPEVLKDLSLHFAPGEYVGIVGPSGCGKSTLLKLLLGFEKPDSGRIYYDDKDIENVDKRELRKKFGVVLQDGKLISGSIFDNITITAPGATVEQVQSVIEAVGLKEDIDGMPMGLNTVLSEECGTISGGQQQRILIARAIVNNPKILFFDEATSALDNITQSMVCDTLEKMNSTRIVIAHRLSTIIKCDRIIVMDGGKVVEQGSYEELMEHEGLFWQLASRQMA